MELFVILGIIVLVGAVVIIRRAKGRGEDLDTDTGNPPSSRDEA